jgi:hypothetical protein
MNVAAVIAYIESRFGLLEELGIFSQDVEAWIPTALERTKQWAIANGHKADLQRQDTLTLDTVEDALVASVAIPTDMLSGQITRVNHASSAFDYAPVGQKAGFAIIFADVFGHYCEESGRIWAKGPVNGDDPLAGDLLVTGIFAPVLGTLPDKLTPYFLDQMGELAGERTKTNPAGPDAAQAGEV